MMTSVVLPIVIIVVLVAVNGVFVAAEFAVVGARLTRLQALADGGSRGAKWLVSLIARPMGKDSYIAVAQLGITLASVGLGMYGEPAMAVWLYGPFESWGLSTGAAHTVGFIVALSVITYLHVVFGEMIPKAMALQSPEQVSVQVNPVMRTFALLFRPAVIVLNKIAFALMRLLRIPEPDKSALLYTSTELEFVTDESAESGALGEMQRTLIRNAFNLDERTAEELMTIRSNMTTVDITATPAEVDQLIDASSFNRFPVVDGDFDNVVGMVHVKDFIRAEQRGTSRMLADLLRPLPAIPATATAEQILERFRNEHTHMAIVVGEFGETLGLVTMDDVIAEVMDDELARSDQVTVHDNDGSITVAGGVTLADLRDDFGVDLAHPDATTIAGLVLSVSGTVPHAGETVSLDGYQATVDEVSGYQVVQVTLRPSVDAD